jgi:hypothetical protein
MLSNISSVLVSVHLVSYSVIYYSHSAVQLILGLAGGSDLHGPTAKTLRAVADFELTLALKTFCYAFIANAIKLVLVTELVLYSLSGIVLRGEAYCVLATLLLAGAVSGLTAALLCRPSKLSNTLCQSGSYRCFLQNMGRSALGVGVQYK